MSYDGTECMKHQDCIRPLTKQQYLGLFQPKQERQIVATYARLTPSSNGKIQV